MKWQKKKKNICHPQKSLTWYVDMWCLTPTMYWNMMRWLKFSQILFSLCNMAYLCLPIRILQGVNTFVPVVPDCWCDTKRKCMFFKGWGVLLMWCYRQVDPIVLQASIKSNKRGKKRKGGWHKHQALLMMPEIACLLFWRKVWLSVIAKGYGKEEFCGVLGFYFCGD